MFFKQAFFVDSHCHANSFEEVASLKKVLEDAKKADVRKLISCSSSFESIKQNMALAKNHSEIISCAALHPIEACSLSQKDILNIADFVERNIGAFKGIGETGLDFRFASSEQDKQKQFFSFSKFIEISIKHNLPLVVHSRHSHSQIVKHLFSYDIDKVLMHWFFESKKLATQVVDKGFFISVGPAFFDKPDLEKVVKEIPLENMLLETDSPVRFNNEMAFPSWIPKVAKRVATLKDLSVKDVKTQTYKNAVKLFNW